MAAYCQVYGVIHFMSPAGWLPVHRDQLWAQRSVTSTGKLYLLLSLTHAQCVLISRESTCSCCLVDASLSLTTLSCSVNDSASLLWSLHDFTAASFACLNTSIWQTYRHTCMCLGWMDWKMWPVCRKVETHWQISLHNQTNLSILKTVHYSSWEQLIK